LDELELDEFVITVLATAQIPLGQTGFLSPIDLLLPVGPAGE
jgi:hypothetical protein